ARRAARAGQRHGPRLARRDGGRHRAPADRAGMGRAALRLEGLQAREVQRHRAHEGPVDERHRRRADEPRRLGAHRAREGDRGDADGRRDGVGRVLPVLRRPRARHRGRGHRDHPAGRLGARRGGHRGRREGRRDDGLHAQAPLPPL
ncbi:MAG: IMP cyclohydrolase / Phosphoribosylaminoimidazolecarboxamide formyltransferase, partial [uncultured Solirubrobacteraceae bacterium]